MLRSRVARVLSLAAVIACLAFPLPAALATPGAAGVGEPYFPLLGNGGYDVGHYDLTFSYDPATDRLDGTMVIRARATQDLSRFDLDLQQLDVSAVRVNDEPVDFSRDGQELQISRTTGCGRARRSTWRSTMAGSPRRSSARHRVRLAVRVPAHR